MANLTQDDLKTRFESLDMPSEQDFIDLIDTLESNSAVKTTTVSTIGAPTTIEDDFNATTTIIQTSKQINVVVYEKSYYLFNVAIGSYGLGETPTTATNFIQISTPITNTELPVVEVEIVSSVSQGTPITLTQLVSDINATDPFVHGTNTITVIYYRSAFANTTSNRYLFTGAPDSYGFGGTTVVEADFVEVSEDRYNITNSVRQVSVAGTGNVWDDFNLAETEFAATIPMAEILVVIHNSVTYLFNPDVLGDGGTIIYGLGFTPTNASHFIQISSTNPNIDIIVQKVTITSAEPQGTILAQGNLVTDVNNGATEIIQAPNTTTIITHESSYSNTSKHFYLFAGANGTYGNGGLPAVYDDFELIGSDDFNTINSFQNIDVAGNGNVWDDFNANVALVKIDPIPQSEVYTVTHDEKTWLFSPEVFDDGSPKTYGYNGNTTALTSNFVQISDDGWLTTLPDFAHWLYNTLQYSVTAKATFETVNGITKLALIKNDVDYTAKIELRGHIKMVGAIVATDKLLNIDDVTFNCTTPKLVYLGDETNSIMYLCKWGTDGLYAAESIPDLTVLDLDSYYYYDNTITGL